MSGIEWRNIACAQYSVSSNGDIISIISGDKISIRTNARGEAEATLIIDGKNTSKVVHRLVYNTFKGEPRTGLVVAHINGDKMDNRLENLYVGTRTEVAKRNLELGISKNVENVPKNKSSHNISKGVCKIDVNGNTIAIYNSISDAATDANCERRNIAKVCDGKRKSAGGFIWKYVD
jgi:hypothetical protein